MDFFTTCALVTVLTGFVLGLAATRFKFRWAIGLGLAAVGVVAFLLLDPRGAAEAKVDAVGAVGLGGGALTALLWPRKWSFAILLLPLEVSLIRQGVWAVLWASACRTGNSL